MGQRILKIIETADRGTVDEQDDPIVWLTHTLRGNGAAIDVLLRGNAVNYLVRCRDASVLEGVAVYYVEEDVEARGLGRDELLGAAQPIAQAALPELLGRYEQVWHF